MSTTARRTVLAVPGSSEKFIAKSRTLPADAVFLDLEDAVAPGAKQAARELIVAALRDPGGWSAGAVTVRVNDWTTPWTVVDLTEVIGGAGDAVDAIVLPKVTSVDHVRATDMVLTQIEKQAGLPVGRVKIEAQIEEAQGVLAVDQIANSSPRLISLVFGPGDFMASMGMAGLSVGSSIDGYAADPFHYPLMAILLAARAHGLLAVDGPYVNIRDHDGFISSARKSAALGYDGKWVIHPSQIEFGNEIYSPNADMIARAQRIVDAYESSASMEGGHTGAIVVDDEMVDEAGVKLAHAVLSRRSI